MATDNRTGHSLFPDVTEHYEREPATPKSAPAQAPPVEQTPVPVPGPSVEQTPVPVPGPLVEQTPVPVPGPPVEPTPAPIPESAGNVLPGDLPADAEYPQLDTSSESDLPDEFDQMPTWLVAPDSPTPEPKKRKKREKRDKSEKREDREKREKREKQVEQEDRQEREEREEAKSGGRKPLLIGGVAVALLAIASAATVVALRGGDSATEGTPKPVAAATTSGTSATSTTTEAAAPVPAWCAESAADGRSVGRGPGSTSDGPGVIRAFDHAYYVERDGARVASLMVAPQAVPEIQKWIDDVALGTEHCVTIASTPDPNVFNVDLGLRTPGSSDGVIRQRITVAPSPEGFKIAKVEDIR